jgi:hypothetical protein
MMNLLQKQDVHGSLTGRFLDGATISSSNADLDVKVDPSKSSTDTKINLVITPKKVMFPPNIDLVVIKGKDSANISTPVTVPQPMPTLTKLDPNQITQGSDLEVTLTGSNLFDLSPSFVFSRGGVVDNSVTATNLTFNSPNSLKATISAKNASPGILDVSVAIGKMHTGTVALTIKAKP